MIQVEHLTKDYGQTRAVNDLSFTVRPGIVTGFLGPNGSGKSTTMRMILGLDAATEGWATVNGRALHMHGSPLREIGALLDAKSVHPKRSARDHLRALALTNAIPSSRVTDVLALVGLEAVAGRAAGEFSLGMSQRLGIAAALLGDPQTIMLDEPVNGLDPEGIVWIRHMLRELAAEGRTVFVSSHLMSEMAMTADHFIIVGQGRLIVDVSAEELAAMGGAHGIRVTSPDIARLRLALDRAGGTTTDVDGDTIVVSGVTPEHVGTIARNMAVVLHELTPLQPTLEATFMELTHEAAQYAGHLTNEKSE